MRSALDTRTPPPPLATRNPYWPLPHYLVFSSHYEQCHFDTVVMFTVTQVSTLLRNARCVKLVKQCCQHSDTVTENNAQSDEITPTATYIFTNIHLQAKFYVLKNSGSKKKEAF